MGVTVSSESEYIQWWVWRMCLVVAARALRASPRPYRCCNTHQTTPAGNYVLKLPGQLATAEVMAAVFCDESDTRHWKAACMRPMLLLVFAISH